MQLKQVRTGTVYAHHRSADYDKDRGVPVVVLDTTIWSERMLTSGSRQHRPAPGERARNDRSGYSGGYLYGLPVLILRGATWQDHDPAEIVELLTESYAVSEQLANHPGGTQFKPAWDACEFRIVSPRELHGEWGTYVDERQAAKLAREQKYEARDAERAAEQAATAAARARIQAVLPDHPVHQLGQHQQPDLTWVQLADMLDAYADSRGQS